MHRGLLVIVLVVAVAIPAATQDPAVEEPQPFDEWLVGLMADARQRGFNEQLIERTLAGLEPLTRVIENDRSQAELVVGFDRYYQARASAQVIRRGQDLAWQHRRLFSRLERAYGVQRRFLLAIWGMETRYGSVTGSTPVFQALATLAWEGRRAEFFTGELFNALTMVSRGHIDAATMTGSWAGAMGQPQFMSSSYLRYAQDFDGDGRRDIWQSTGDALASIANYLQEFGWDDGFTWGREVRISAEARARIRQETTQRTGGCSAMRDMTERKPLDQWQAMGVRLVNGRALPRSSVPAGLVETDTRAFLVYPNYDALLRYNCAHYYALSVVLLGEQLR